MKRFLIVKTSSLGDIIHAFSALSYLRQRFPQAEIDWVVEKSFSELVVAHPDINQALLIDSKTWRKHLFSAGREIFQFRNELQKTTYDAVFDLQGNIKSSLITALADAADKVGFGWNTVHEKANTFFTNRRYNPPAGVNIREDNLQVIKGYFQDTKSFTEQRILLKMTVEQELLLKGMQAKIQGKAVMVCPGSAWPNKQLTKEALIDFLRRTQEYLLCSYVFVWGSQSELKLAEEMHTLFPNSVLSIKLPLPALQNLMELMELVIAMDSLPLHLAGTTKTKTFSVFGASLANKFKPMGDAHISLQGQCPYGRRFEKRCPILRVCKTGACIRNFTGSAVFDTFKCNWDT